MIFATPTLIGLPVSALWTKYTPASQGGARWLSGVQASASREASSRRTRTCPTSLARLTFGAMRAASAFACRRCAHAGSVA